MMRHFSSIPIAYWMACRLGWPALAAAFPLIFVPFHRSECAEFNISSVEEFQSALTSAASNEEDDTINVAEGTYDVKSTLNYFCSEPFSIEIIGGGPATTILDGGGSVQILSMASEARPEFYGDEISMTVSGLTFRNGMIPAGGNNPGGAGAHLRIKYGDMTVSNNRFIGNRAEGAESDGGGLYMEVCNFGMGDLVGNIFAENYATRSGGGSRIYTTSNTTRINLACNLFAKNVASGGIGGGLFLGSECELSSENNTFFGNVAVDGGGIQIDPDSPPFPITLHNDIIWGNTPNQIAYESYFIMVGAVFSNIQGGSSREFFDYGSIDQDPIFFNSENPAGADGTYGTFDDGLHLEPDSPCSEAGDAAFIFQGNSFDVAGNDRTEAGAVDMGCYQGSAVKSLPTLRLAFNPPNLNPYVRQATGTVTRLNADISAALTVSLSSSDYEETGIPASVQIPEGQSAASFTLTAVNYDYNTEDLQVTITASAEGFQSGSKVVLVTDNEFLAMEMAVPSVEEGAETVEGTVFIPFKAEKEISVGLSVSDPAEARVPLLVTIPTGASSTVFTLEALDDNAVDGNKGVKVTASSAYFNPGSAEITVVDSDSVDRIVAPGAVFSLIADYLGADASGRPFKGTEFTDRPRLSAEYFHPVKDPSGKKLRNASVRIRGIMPNLYICEWKKKICLYDKKAIIPDQDASTYIPLVQKSSLLMDGLWARTGDLQGNRGPFDAGKLILMPPSISGVFKPSDLATETGIAYRGDVLVITGKNFGTRPPRVWLEYRAASGKGIKVKSLPCKVLKPYAFQNLRFEDGMSCMDLSSISNESRISVLIPKKFPKDWHSLSVRHDIVIDNGIGRAAIPFKTY